MKVYKMDDYQCHAGETLEQCIELYEEQTGEVYDGESWGYPTECDIETCGVWVEIDSDEKPILQQSKDKTTLGDTKIIGYTQYCKFMSFKDANEKLKESFPYVIASTEI